MSFVLLNKPLSQNVYKELTALSWFTTTSALFCTFCYVINHLLTLPYGYALLFALPRAVTRVYFDPINYYFD